MPPNLKLENIVQNALPYDQPTYKKGGPSVGEISAVYVPGSSAQLEVADDDDEEPVLRITTRARYTYELDRFEKNAVLVINNRKEDTLYTNFVLHAFKNHRFELSAIETAHNSRGEIWEKVDQFFRRDFSDYGAVAVVTVNCPVMNAPDRDNCVKEWDLLNYFSLNQPPSLAEKPKIFISETTKLSSPPLAIHLPSDMIVVETQRYTYFDTDFNATDSRPLDILCYKLLAMEGHRDFLEILNEVSRESVAPFPNRRIQLVHLLNTLTKELIFQRDSSADCLEDDWKSHNPVHCKTCWPKIRKSLGASLIMDHQN